MLPVDALRPTGINHLGASVTLTSAIRRWVGPEHPLAISGAVHGADCNQVFTYAFCFTGRNDLRLALPCRVGLDGRPHRQFRPAGRTRVYKKWRRQLVRGFEPDLRGSRAVPSGTYLAFVLAHV